MAELRDIWLMDESPEFLVNGLMKKMRCSIYIPGKVTYD